MSVPEKKDGLTQQVLRHLHLTRDDVGLKPWEVAHFKGMARLGLNELRGLFYAESNIKEVDAGVFGRATPAEISSVRSPELMGHGEDRERHNLLERKQAELRQQVQPEVSREMEK